MRRVRLLAEGTWRGDDPRPLPELRYASPAGRSLFALGAPWLADEPRVTGIYHALGREKMPMLEAIFSKLAQSGFSSVKPVELVFQHQPYGVVASVAIALGCTGPFWTIEGDVTAGALCFLQATADLEAGRCDRALVVGFDPSRGESWAVLLEATERGDGVVLDARYTFGATPPSAPTGMTVMTPAEDAEPQGITIQREALRRAQSGEPTATWVRAADGRGVLVLYRREEDA